MRWIVTVPTNDGHGHIDVADPTWAAIVIGLLNDLRGRPVRATVAPWTGDWRCPSCGYRRREPHPPPER